MAWELGVQVPEGVRRAALRTAGTNESRAASAISGAVGDFVSQIPIIVEAHPIHSWLGRGKRSCRGVPTTLITQVTRRKIFDTITLSKVFWEGRLEEPDFLARIYDLDTMPSTDSRYKTAAGDIWQHRVNNPEDWPDDWVFTDSRFGLQHGDWRVPRD